MDSTTQFIDTLNLLTKEIEGLQSYITKTNQELTSICGKISRGDIRDRETRLAKLSEASAAVEKVRALAVYAFSTRVEKFYGSLETLHAMLEQNDNEMWKVLETQELLSASQTVDRLTDAIADLFSTHNGSDLNPRYLFIDNPDAFVADFVKQYLDHRITDRMSDTVISLVNDWVFLRNTES